LKSARRNPSLASGMMKIGIALATATNLNYSNNTDPE